MKITTIYLEQSWILLSNTQLVPWCYQPLYLCPWAKPVPQMSLPLLEAGLVQFSLTHSPYGPQGLYSLPQYMEVLFGQGTHSIPCSLVQMSMRLFLKWVPLSNWLLWGLPCPSRTCFSRAKMEFQAVAGGTGHLSSHPAVVPLFVTISACLGRFGWSAGLSPSPIFFFWSSSTIPQGFTCLICWAAAHIHSVLVAGVGMEFSVLCGCDNTVYCKPHTYQWGYGISRKSQGSARRGSGSP